MVLTEGPESTGSKTCMKDTVVAVRPNQANTSL